VIDLESAWNPAARNTTSGASGLIQVTPEYANVVGMSIHTVRSLSGAEQVSRVAHPWWAYHKRVFRPDYEDPGDVLMAVFFPTAIGKAASYRMPDWAYGQNEGLD